MATPKINTVLSFSSKGINGVNNDVKSVVSGVNGATSAVGKFSEKISSIQKGVAFQSAVAAVDAVKDAFSTVIDTVGGFVSAIYEMASSQAGAADAIAKTSSLLGMQVSELQAIRSAGQHAGMTVESVDSAMQKFSINIGKVAAGEQRQIDLMNALGVSAKNADGSMRDQIDVLMDVADAYAKLSDSRDRNIVSQELFGKSAVQMSTLLKDGASGIRASVELYKKTNAGYTAEQTKQAEEFDDELQTMQEYISGVKKDLFFALVPAFTKLFQGVSKFLEDNRPEIDAIVESLSDELPILLHDVTAALPVILSGVSMIASAVGTVIDFTGPWIPLLTIAGVIIGGAILTAVGAVGVAVSAVGTAFGGAIAAAAPIIGVIALAGAGIIAWGYAIKSVYDNFDMLKSFVVDDIYPAFVSGVKQFANEFIDVFAMIADGMAKIPLIGEKIAGGAGDWWRAQKFDTGSFVTVDDQAIPSGESNVAEATGTTATASSSSLTVDFRGVPRGTKITPSNDFDYNNIDYSAGYAFGG